MGSESDHKGIVSHNCRVDDRIKVLLRGLTGTSVCLVLRLVLERPNWSRWRVRIPELIRCQRFELRTGTDDRRGSVLAEQVDAVTRRYWLRPAGMPDAVSVSLLPGGGVETVHNADLVDVVDMTTICERACVVADSFVRLPEKPVACG